MQDYITVRLSKEIVLRAWIRLRTGLNETHGPGEWYRPLTGRRSLLLDGEMNFAICIAWHCSSGDDKGSYFAPASGSLVEGTFAGGTAAGYKYSITRGDSNGVSS